MNWFGAFWGAIICTDCPKVSTPVGVLCPSCDKPIEEFDRGVTMVHWGDLDAAYQVPGSELQRSAWHFDCHMRSILGDKWRYLDAHA